MVAKKGEWLQRKGKCDTAAENYDRRKDLASAENTSCWFRRALGTAYQE